MPSTRPVRPPRALSDGACRGAAGRSTTSGRTRTSGRRPPRGAAGGATCDMPDARSCTSRTCAEVTADAASQLHAASRSGPWQQPLAPRAAYSTGANSGRPAARLAPRPRAAAAAHTRRRAAAGRRRRRARWRPRVPSRVCWTSARTWSESARRPPPSLLLPLPVSLLYTHSLPP